MGIWTVVLRDQKTDKVFLRIPNIEASSYRDAYFTIMPMLSDNVRAHTFDGYEQSSIQKISASRQRGIKKYLKGVQNDRSNNH